jgi:hypothetical protein
MYSATDFEFEAKLQTVLFVVEALTYLGLALWFLNRNRDGRWALVGALGAVLLGGFLGITAAASFEAVFFESDHIARAFYPHEHFGTVITIGRVLGVLLLAAGIVESRRTPPAPTGSIYGP